MNARSKLLRQNVVALREKASAGKVGVRVATDLSVRLPARLLVRIEQLLKSGELEARWQKHLDDAEELGPDCEMGALAALLIEFTSEVGREARAFAAALESKRSEMLGRAAGIEEGLAAVEEPKKAASEPDG